MKRCLSSCAHAVAVLVLFEGDHSFDPSAVKVPPSAALAQPIPSCSSTATVPVRQRLSATYRPRRHQSLVARFFSETGEELQVEDMGGGGAGETGKSGDGEGSMIGKSALGATGAERDSACMRRALELAARGLGRTRPNPAVGCVIVDKNGVVVGEGFHPRAGEPHAEVWAIRQAKDRARGGTAYVTLEPCNHFGRTPPCTTALVDSGILRVVAGMVDPDPRTAGGGLKRLAERGLDVSVGVEAAACQTLNSPFAHRIWEKSCYGVLHCSLGGVDSSELEDTCQEAALTLLPAYHSYKEHDAIVVEGCSGVAKLEACLESLPSTTLLVVVVTSAGGIEEELGPVSESRLWEDPTDGSVLVVAVSETAGSVSVDSRLWTPSVHQQLHDLMKSGLTRWRLTEVMDTVAENGRIPGVRSRFRLGWQNKQADAGWDGRARLARPNNQGNEKSPGPIRTRLASRGVGIVEFSLPPEQPQQRLPSVVGQTSLASAQEVAAAAVSRELYRRGMLSAAWDVGPGLATKALKGGHIQRVLVRKRQRGGGVGKEQEPPSGGARGGPEGETETEIGEAGRGQDSDEDEEEVALAVGVIGRLCGKGSGEEGVRARLRRNDGLLPWAGSEAVTEVVLPVPAIEVDPSSRRNRDQF